MLEDRIEALTVAVMALSKLIAENTAALASGATAPPKVSKKKTSSKKTKDKPVAEEKPVLDPLTGKPVVEEDTTATAEPMEPEKVQTHLRGIAAQLKDTSKLFELIQKHGGQQFSELDASVYPALIADAEQLVVDGA